MASLGGPNIVTDGLVLMLDAANKRSYPGTAGATWSDLSGNNYNGAGINTPVFSSANGGILVFNGANNAYNFGNVLNYTSENFTFSYWVNFSNLATQVGGQGPVGFHKATANTYASGYYDQANANGSVKFVTNQGGVAQVSSTAANIVAIGNWYNLAYVRNGASVRVYVNGIDQTATAGTHIDPTANANNLWLAYTGGTSVSGLTMSNFSNYNRNLSADEVLQNYNALKSRFNLT